MIKDAKILSNTMIAADVYRMVFQTDLGAQARPGQFVMIRLPELFLRRPISISDSDDKTLTIVYKIMGKGTDEMSRMEPGTVISLEGPLGQGFPILDRDAVLLMGGGVGTPPLLKTAKEFLKKNIHVDVVLGFASSADIFYIDEFEQLGIVPMIATMDGSVGTKGTVLDAIKEHDCTTTFVEACGPLPMLKAISAAYTDGYISLEHRMACGIGVCMACVVQGTNGMALRVCKNGPVFPIGKVVL